MTTTQTGLPESKFAPAKTHSVSATRGTNHKPKTDYATAAGRRLAAKKLAALYLEREVAGDTEQEKYDACHNRWAELQDGV